MNAPARLLPPTLLAALGNLPLVARTVVEGALTGLHRSPRFGFSQEFAEYRAYAPGDDLRFVDWNVFARTDRTYVKRYFGETNTRVMVLLDTSASMGIEPSRGAIRKLDFARFLTAAVIYLAARQHDAVGLAAFADAVREYRPPSSRARAVDALFHRLDELEAEGETNWADVLEQVMRRLAKRSLLVVVSDFFCDPSMLARQLAALAALGHDLLLFHVLDPAERRLPITGSATLRDVETGALMTVTGDELRYRHPERLGAHLHALEQAVARARGHYRLMNTDQPLDRSLADYLRVRERRP